MTGLVRSFLSLEAAVFGAAALMHLGALVQGHEHAKAATAESVIALVLFGGLAATVVAPASSRPIGIVAQGFALLGTLVGILTIAIGVGPRTPVDLVLHAAMIALLAGGLTAVTRRRQVGAADLSG
jgi:hypothetical protein